jgi:hypothetical protein
MARKRYKPEEIVAKLRQRGRLWLTNGSCIRLRLRPQHAISLKNLPDTSLEIPSMLCPPLRTWTTHVVQFRSIGITQTPLQCPRTFP